MTVRVLALLGEAEYPEILLLHAEEAFGPRKRLLPWAFAEGDCLHNQRTGENMMVRRSDHRGVLVRRAIGTVQAQPIKVGDEILRFTNSRSWLAA